MTKFNKYDAPEGYIAVCFDHNGMESCCDCALDCTDLCDTAMCCPADRKDGQSVYFIKKPDNTLDPVVDETDAPAGFVAVQDIGSGCSKCEYPVRGFSCNTASCAAIERKDKLPVYFVRKVVAESPKYVIVSKTDNKAFFAHTPEEAEEIMTELGDDFLVFSSDSALVTKTVTKVTLL